MLNEQDSKINQLINSNDQIITNNNSSSIIISTRIRLARNLDYNFPNQAKKEISLKILNQCKSVCESIDLMKDSTFIEINKISPLEAKILAERNIISHRLIALNNNSAFIINKSQNYCIMINEEDHLRIQVLDNNFNLEESWRIADYFDSILESQLNYAFSSKLGYLNSCPSNLGTGMRASVMMHLPALLISNKINNIINSLNKQNIVFRGIFGEESFINNSIFQISNQNKIGENEEDILKKITVIFNDIMYQEISERELILSKNKNQIFDKIGRAFGILLHSKDINFIEATNLLSLMRFAVDLNIFPQKYRSIVDMQFIKIQPSHLEILDNKHIGFDKSNLLRSIYLNKIFQSFPFPVFY